VLQTSQVLFRCLCVSLAVVLPFKDSQGGIWLLDLFDFNWRHASLKKNKRSVLITPRHLPLIKISVPPLARPLNPAAPRPALSNCRIPLAGLMRGFARYLR
jgi:hypothetical protein